MALRALMLRKKIDTKKQELKNLRDKDADFKTRETNLEKSIEEAATEEEKDTVEQEIIKFDKEKKEHEESKSSLEKEIGELERELAEVEKEQISEPLERGRKEDKDIMIVRKKIHGLTLQERAAFLQRQDVKDFLERVRNVASEKRTITGAELTIPEVMLELIRENITEYSKLVKYVNIRPVSGKARQNIMGTIPEAVWTEMCASLNELEFGFNQTEVDGYKVAGIIYISTDTVEDSDINLIDEIIRALGIAIGIALDKAILYGVGTKMPLGIVPRLAQDEQPGDYPANARTWSKLDESNIITIEGTKHGLDFYKAIVAATKNMKSKYSTGNKFWAMNESTKITLIEESMNFNNAGAITALEQNTMPVVGGDIVVLSDEIISDGNIVGGYGSLYLLAERKGGTFARSDEYKFADDQIAFKGTARYDGEPVIAEGFIAIGIGAAPATAAKFTGDKANDATLEGLMIGSETLSPQFSSSVFAYTIASATAAIVQVTANASQSAAKIEIEYQGKKYPNGGAIKLLADSTAHDIKVHVKNGASRLTYTVAVTKASA